MKEDWIYVWVNNLDGKMESDGREDGLLLYPGWRCQNR
jgi:hypothetical protein